MEPNDTTQNSAFRRTRQRHFTGNGIRNLGPKSWTEKSEPKKEAKKGVRRMSADLVVSRLDSARRALAEAKTLQQTKTIADVARAAEIYARRQKLGEEAIHYATEIKFDAERKLGQILKDTPRNAGGRPKTGSLEVPVSVPTLRAIGIDKKTSVYAQALAALSDEAFERVKAGNTAVFKAAVKAQKRENLDKERADFRRRNLTPLLPIDGQRKMRAVRFVHEKTKIAIYELRIGPTPAGSRFEELRREVEARECFRHRRADIDGMENEAKRLRAEAERLEKDAREANSFYNQEIWRRLEEEHGRIQSGTELYSLFIRDRELRDELLKLGKEDSEQIAARLVENWASGKVQCVARGIDGDISSVNYNNFSLPYHYAAELPARFPSRLPSGRTGWTGVGNELMADGRMRD